MSKQPQRQTVDPRHIENTVNSLAIKELALPKAFYTYRSMLSDEIIGGAFQFIKSALSKGDYRIKITSEMSDAETRLIKKLNKSLENLQGMNKTEFILQVLSFLEYGHSMFEMNFKREDGAFVFNTFVPIHPINVRKYVYEQNTLTKLELKPQENDGVVFQNQVAVQELEGDKVLMFRNNPDLDNPLGTSLLNRCFKPWKKKEIASEYELIGVAKNLSGVLLIEAPSEYLNAYYSDPTSEQALYMEELFDQAENIHGGKTSFAAIPSDVSEGGQAKFKLTTIGNSSTKSDIDTNAIINRYETSILMTLYTDVMSLGQNGSGSFALSDSKTNLLALVIESIRNGLARNFQTAIKKAYELNAVTPKGDLPTLQFDEIEKLDLEAFSRGMQRLVKDDVIQSDDKFEAWVRERVGAPEKDVATTRTKETTKQKTDDNERDDKEA